MSTDIIQVMLEIAEWVLFVLIGLSVLYITIFGILSRVIKRKYSYPEANEQESFLIILPAYAEDKVIIESAKRILEQDYPQDKYKVVVVSDHHSDETNAILNDLPIQNIIASYQDSSKAKALKLAMSKQTESFNHVVILDADNFVEPSFLHDLNNVCHTGYKAIQCHRLASPTRQTPVARLDAISEEINNSIFRRAHINVGLSSALIGSGMCFEYQWFKENVILLSTAGEDKELEQRLLFQRIHIHYAEDIYVYDEKVKKSGNFQSQRRRWMAAQFFALTTMIKDLPKALQPFNLDYVDKTFQQAILPRLLNIFLVVVFSILITILHPAHSIKWWIMLVLFFMALYIAVPRYYKTKDTLKALFEIPKLVMLTILNLFHLKGAAKKFIHTQHGEN